MKRRMKYTKGCGKLSSNDTLFSYIQFSVVKKEEEDTSQGVEYCGPVKTINKVFYLSMLEKSTKYRTGGYYIFMKSTPRITDNRTLMTIDKKEKNKGTIHLIQW